MSLLVDFSNKEVKDHIRQFLALTKTDDVSPWITIPRDQFTLYKWAKAYEELQPLVTDHIYDMFVRYLRREQIMFPTIWESCSLSCFKDASWSYTGMFIEGHNKEDEEWLL